ncbi:MAG: hypothetical protein ACPGOY_17200 [Rhodospirillaceae bacterium]
MAEALPFPPIPDPNDWETRIQLAILGASKLQGSDPVPGAGKVTEENGVPVQTLFNGIKVIPDSYYGDWVTRLIEGSGGYHEPQEEVVFAEILRALDGLGPASGQSMIELGCYWAYYSAWFLAARTGAKAYCLDSFPPALLAGQATMALNGVRGASFAHGAVGKVSFDALGPDGQPEKQLVPRVTVGDLMDQHGLSQLTILHADIQGFEALMLAEARDMLAAARIDYLVISTHSQDLHQECLLAIKDHGYRIIAEHDLTQSYAFDGMIAAARPGLDRPGPVPIPRRGPMG